MKIFISISRVPILTLFTFVFCVKSYSQELRSATFPGGVAEMNKFLKENVVYPAEANGAEGRVIVSFVVDEVGSIVDAKVIRSINPYLDAEALRVVKLMPKWTNALVGEIPVKENFSLPIRFVAPKVSLSQTKESGNTTEDISSSVPASSPSSTSISDGDFLAKWNWGNFPISPTMKTVYINKYETEYLFSDGILAVKNTETGKWGFVDEDGNLLEGNYKWRTVDFTKPRFGAGHCLVAQERENNPKILDWYILDKKGNARRFNIDSEIHSVSPFNSDGIVTVVVEYSNKGLDMTGLGKIKYFNTDGIEVFHSICCDAELGAIFPLGDFKDDRALFGMQGNEIIGTHYGYIDRAGNIINKDNLYLQAQEFSEGLAAVLVDTDAGKRWGFIDVNGKMVIPAKFSYEPSPFRCGYSVAKKQNGSMVFINKNGDVCSGEFQYLTNFVNDYALGCINMTSYVIGTDMKAVEVKDLEHSIVYHLSKNLPVNAVVDGKYISYTGSFYGDGLIWPQTGKSYALRAPFCENRFHVKIKDEHFFLDRSGQIVIKFAKEEF